VSEGKQLPEGFRYADEVPARSEPVPPEVQPKRRRNLEDLDLQKVYTLKEALGRFRSRKPGAHKVTDVNFEGARIGAVFEGLNERYLVMFKREFYRRFSEHFPDVPQRGYGVVTAKKIVGWAADEGLILAAVFPSGRCYSIDGYDFWLFYEEYKTDCRHLKGEEIAAPLEAFKRLF